MVAVDSADRTLTIAHHDVPGLMKAMTMPFLVAPDNDWVFRAIAPGDYIHATLVMGTHAELQEISFTKGGGENSGTSNLHIPEPGDPVPDFRLLNQDGRTIHLAQFRGKPLLVTFIYTRCPMPDFCVRMSSNFQSVLKTLAANPKTLAQAQLLSISIDPGFDKPKVLRNYGEHYVKGIDPGFAHWQFATGSPEAIRKAANFFGLAYNEKDGQIVHSLSTVLVSSDGKVLKVYSGNSWSPEEVARDYAAAAGS